MLHCVAYIPGAVEFFWIDELPLHDLTAPFHLFLSLIKENNEFSLQLHKGDFIPHVFGFLSPRRGFGSPSYRVLSTVSLCLSISSLDANHFRPFCDQSSHTTSPTITDLAPHSGSEFEIWIRSLNWAEWRENWSSGVLPKCCKLPASLPSTLGNSGLATHTTGSRTRLPVMETVATRRLRCGFCICFFVSDSLCARSAGSTSWQDVKNLPTSKENIEHGDWKKIVTHSHLWRKNSNHICARIGWTKRHGPASNRWSNN